MPVSGILSVRPATPCSSRRQVIVACFAVMAMCPVRLCSYTGKVVVIEIKEINMRYFIALFALMGVVSLSACNTVQGVGKDIEKAGESIKKAGS
jgi:entericidin B